jgi:DNA-binding IclR family transcriptional regulator
MECVYLDCIYKYDQIGFDLIRIGKRTPMHSSGSGKLFLSEYTDIKLDYFINEKNLNKLTEKTITTKDDLIKELDKVRYNGYSIDDEECETNLRCVSVPIFDYQDRIVAAISSFGSTSQFTYEVIKNDVLPLLKNAASEISFRLGGKLR